MTFDNTINFDYRHSRTLRWLGNYATTFSVQRSCPQEAQTEVAERIDDIRTDTLGTPAPQTASWFEILTSVWDRTVRFGFLLSDAPFGY